MTELTVSSDYRYMKVSRDDPDPPFALSLLCFHQDHKAFLALSRSNLDTWFPMNPDFILKVTGVSEPKA